MGRGFVVGWVSGLMPERSDVANEIDPGGTAHFAAYYRDQKIGDSTAYRITMPDGLVWQSWSQVADVTHDASWWYWTWTLPADAAAGPWQWEADYLGESYRRDFSVSGTPTANDRSDLPGEAVSIEAAFPNPFRGRTQVRFRIQEAAPVDLVVTDVLGRPVRQLESGHLAAGVYTRSLEATDLPPGVYFCTITVSNHTATRALVAR